MSEQVYNRLVGFGAPKLWNDGWRYTVERVIFDDVNPAVVYVERRETRRGPFGLGRREVWVPVGRGYPVVEDDEKDARPLEFDEWGYRYARAAKAAVASAERAMGMDSALRYFEGSHQ